MILVPCMLLQLIYELMGAVNKIQCVTGIPRVTSVWTFYFFDSKGSLRMALQCRNMLHISI
jgi:hypothetical protein